MSFGSNGVIVPTTIAKKIIEKVSELSPIYEKVEKFHTKGTLEIPVYETEMLSPVIQDDFQAVVFFSPSGVRSFTKYNSS